MVVKLPRPAGGSGRDARLSRLTILFLVALLGGSLRHALAGTPSQAAQPLPTNPAQPRPPAQTANPLLRRTGTTLAVKVLSETGAPVVSADIILTPEKGSKEGLQGETNYSGKFRFTGLTPGVYQLRVQKEGFYVAEVPKISVGVTRSVKLTLNHVRKITESVKVVYSPPVIDPEETASGSSLNSREIIDLPYVVPRDLRYALPLLPGVLQDASGRVHVDGAASRQTFDQLDGFDITDPVTGEFNVRVAPEALRRINVEDSRYPVQYGDGSGGILALESDMGDDHYRFAGVNFLPTVDDQQGLHLSSWTPRLTFSGPLHKGKAWFMDGFDGEYDLFLVNGLPPGAGHNTLLRISNLAKAQVNLTPSNILTASFLVNHLSSPHEGLSLFEPLESTMNSGEDTYFLSAKDQVFFPSQTYLEFGIAATKLQGHALPWGNQTYVQFPGSVTGSYFETSHDTAGRTEEIANLYLPAKDWLGKHLFQFGTDDYQVTYNQSYLRNPFLIEGKNDQILQRVRFVGNQAFTVHNVEASSYAQDRWSVRPRLLIESGVRFDWDEMVHDALFSPRLAATFMPSERSDTKLVAGIGLYNDATNLGLITQPLAGERLDYFNNPVDEVPAGTSVETSFQLQPHLQEPRVWNWSVGVEQKLPGSIYLRAEYLQKREEDGWAYFNEEPLSPGQISGNYELEDAARDRYDAVQTTFRRAFKRGNIVMVSYVRSMARSNAVLDFNLESPIFAPQGGGPLPWDAPNRLLSWGLVPLVKGFDLAYTFDWRTGFPFSVFNQNQQLVGVPDSYRMPAYFSADAALERRISLLGFKWDVRAGFDDLTGRHNPYVVNNNIDSPQFMNYSSIQRRTLQAQIRLLGRK